MKLWFFSLQPRERVMVAAGTFVVLLTALYMLIWEPLQVGHQRAVEDIDRKTRLVNQARVLLPSDSGPSGPTRDRNQSLTVLVATTVNANGLANAYKSSSPSGNNGLRVSLENASFDAILTWLSVLESEYSIRVDASSVTRRPQAGRVDASIVLSRAL